MSQTDVHLLPTSKVCARYNISDRTVDRWLMRPELNFPQPIRISGRRYWREAEITAWERTRAGTTGSVPPCSGERL